MTQNAGLIKAELCITTRGGDFMKLYKSIGNPWEPPIYHGRYKKRRVHIQKDLGRGWFFVIYGNSIFNSLWKNLWFNSPEAAGEAAMKWIDKEGEA